MLGLRREALETEAFQDFPEIERQTYQIMIADDTMVDFEKVCVFHSKNDMETIRQDLRDWRPDLAPEKLDLIRSDLRMRARDL